MIRSATIATRRGIIVLLTCATFSTAVLMFWNVERTWYRRNRDGRVVGSVCVGSAHGRLIIVENHTSDRVNPPPPLKADIQMWPIYTRIRASHSARVEIHNDADPLFLTTIEQRLTLVVPLMVFSAYPAISFIRGPLRRWRRRRKGLCLKCGYDLTGNVTGVCPECGVGL